MPKNLSLRDYCPRTDRYSSLNQCEADLKQIQHENLCLKSQIDRLNSLVDDLKGENFALNCQINEYEQLVPKSIPSKHLYATAIKNSPSPKLTPLVKSKSSFAPRPAPFPCSLPKPVAASKSASPPAAKSAASFATKGATASAFASKGPTASAFASKRATVPGPAPVSKFFSRPFCDRPAQPTGSFRNFTHKAASPRPSGRSLSNQPPTHVTTPTRITPPTHVTPLTRITPCHASAPKVASPKPSGKSLPTKPHSFAEPKRGSPDFVPLDSAPKVASPRPSGRSLTSQAHALAEPKRRSPNFDPSASAPKGEIQKVRIYHDSNLRWSSPSEIQRSIRDFQLGNAESCNIMLSYTPRLEDVLRAVEHDDNKNVKVVIATMTNNAKGHQEVSKTEALLRKVVASLKRQVLARDIVFLESPASLNFDIFPYNQMANSLCKSAGITFALNLVARPHIKTDGLHILTPFKYLMVTSVAAAIMKKEPYRIFGLVPLRRPFSNTS